jgi:16S rRNA G966 N2-methylase RsmD
MSNNETFYFPYSGNKRNELIYLNDLLEDVDYKKIVEPFGGSCAFSIDQYSKNNNLECYISDINKELTMFCNNFYKFDLLIINNTLEDIAKIKNKEEYNDHILKIKKYNNVDETKEDEVLNFCSGLLFYKTYYYKRPGLYPIEGRAPQYKNLLKNKERLNLFYKKFKYVNQDFKIYMEMFKDDENALIFLDPPYVASDNSAYTNEAGFNKIDIRKTFQECWGYLHNYFENCKCKFILVVNDNFFMDIAFKKYYYKSYDKLYQQSKYNCKHNIYTNIKK